VSTGVKSFHSAHDLFVSIRQFIPGDDSIEIILGTYSIDIDFEAVPTYGNSPLSVQFTTSGTEAGDTFSWDFGDGNTSTEENPTNIYTVPGIYTIVLIYTRDSVETRIEKKDYILVNIRYYVSPITAYWDNSANWSATSGGPGGASIPDSSMISCFDGGIGGNGQGQCLLDIPVSVNEIRMTQDYTGKVIQYELPVHANKGNFDGGTFDGGPGNIQIDNTAYFCHTKFISTRNDLSVGEYFWYEDKHDGSFEKIIVSEEITINSTDVSRKYTTLHSTPDSTSDVLLNIIHGSAQEYGVDYYVDKNRLKWDDKNLEDIIEVGDSLRVIYSATEYTSGFFNNSGRVLLNSDRGILNGGGVEFYDLTFRKDGTNNLYCQIDSSATVENMLYLQDGNLKGSDSTLYVEGDIYLTSIFGAKDSRNTATIEVNGDNYQELIVNTGGVLPTLAVNKSTPDHLKARGTGPISIFGDLVISDGTFHTGGLNLQVGSI
jgi:PKD repeat protein